MNASSSAIDTIKNEEGFSPTAYPDSTGFSIGYGTFIDSADEQYLLHTTIDEAKASQLLSAYVQTIVNEIHARITVPLNQHQLDALVLMLYNTGFAPITSGSLDELINSNAGEQAIRAKWMEYNKSRTADGVLQVNPALTARRQREVDLYFSRPAAASGKYSCT